MHWTTACCCLLYVKIYSKIIFLFLRYMDMELTSKLAVKKEDSHSSNILNKAILEIMNKKIKIFTKWTNFQLKNHLIMLFYGKV